MPKIAAKTKSKGKSVKVVTPKNKRVAKSKLKTQEFYDVPKDSGISSYKMMELKGIKEEVLDLIKNTKFKGENHIRSFAYTLNGKYPNILNMFENDILGLINNYNEFSTAFKISLKSDKTIDPPNLPVGWEPMAFTIEVEKALLKVALGGKKVVIKEFEEDIIVDGFPQGGRKHKKITETTTLMPDVKAIELYLNLKSNQIRRQSSKLEIEDKTIDPNHDYGIENDLMEKVNKVEFDMSTIGEVEDEKE